MALLQSLMVAPSDSQVAHNVAAVDAQRAPQMKT
jgi:hypothetical protein